MIDDAEKLARIRDIIGPNEPCVVWEANDTGSGTWCVYFPNTIPCACDYFHEAAEMMAEYLKTRRGRRFR